MQTLKAISKRNPYYIPDEQRLELVHFCRQYRQWRLDYADLCAAYPHLRGEIVRGARANDVHPEDEIVARAVRLSQKMDLVDNAALQTDKKLVRLIRDGAIYGLSYDQLNAREPAPCSRSEYYKAMRKFYWILARKR